AIDRDEINNKAVDRMLPTKLPMRQPAISQRLPQASFATCLGLSQLQGFRFEPRQLIRHRDRPCQPLRRSQRGKVERRVRAVALNASRAPLTRRLAALDVDLSPAGRGVKSPARPGTYHAACGAGPQPPPR